MRDPARIEPIIDKLKAYWEANPDQRLGQLIVNIDRMRTGGDSADAFELEDDDLERFLDANT